MFNGQRGAALVTAIKLADTKGNTYDDCDLDHACRVVALNFKYCTEARVAAIDKIAEIVGEPTGAMSAEHKIYNFRIMMDTYCPDWRDHYLDADPSDDGE